MGRPSDFTEALSGAICARLAEGETLRAICQEDGMPGQSTVFRWLEANEAFREQYARAREQQAHTLADETRDIVDNEPDPARARIRFDQRRWHASKLLPKVYGDKQAVEHSGPNGGPIQLTWADGSS